MWLSEIWRYPVKSMGGEKLTEAAIGEEGVPGDRVVHVEDERGRLVTSRVAAAAAAASRDIGK